MTVDFLWGLAVGMIFMGACWVVSARAYRQTLLAIARAGMTERLPDGNHYFIVPEGEYLSRTWPGTPS